MLPCKPALREAGKCWRGRGAVLDVVAERVVALEEPPEPSHQLKEHERLRANRPGTRRKVTSCSPVGDGRPDRLPETTPRSSTNRSTGFASRVLTATYRSHAPRRSGRRSGAGVSRRRGRVASVVDPAFPACSPFAATAAGTEASLHDRNLRPAAARNRGATRTRAHHRTPPRTQRTVVQSWIAQRLVPASPSAPWHRAASRAAWWTSRARARARPRGSVARSARRAVDEFEHRRLELGHVRARPWRSLHPEHRLHASPARRSPRRTARTSATAKWRRGSRRPAPDPRPNLRYLSRGARRRPRTLDLSFISVLKVLPTSPATMRAGARPPPRVLSASPQRGETLALREHEEQREREREDEREQVIARFIEGAGEMGFEYVRHTVSPIKGAKEGNTEFLALFLRDDTVRAPPPETLPRRRSRRDLGARGVVTVPVTLAFHSPKSRSGV